MGTKCTQRGFSNLMPLFFFIIIVIILLVVAPLIAQKLGYDRATGFLALLALSAVWLIYGLIHDYFYRRRKRNRLPPRESLPIPARQEHESFAITTHEKHESLTVTAREKQGITVLEVNGRLSIANHEILHRHFTQLLNAGNKSILLNLAMVSHIDAAGLGALVRLVVAARAAGGKLKLAKPSEQVRRVLESTRLADAIEIYSGEDEAAASFAPHSRP